MGEFCLKKRMIMYLLQLKVRRRDRLDEMQLPFFDPLQRVKGSLLYNRSNPNTFSGGFIMRETFTRVLHMVPAMSVGGRSPNH